MSVDTGDEGAVGQYVTFDEAKNGLDIPDDADKEELTTIVKESNQDMEMIMFPHVDVLPIPDGTPVFKACSRAGMLYVKARWKEKKHNFEVAKTLDKLYAEKMRNVIKALEAKPTDRTKSFLISQDSREDKLPLPTQYANFVFDDFA